MKISIIFPLVLSVVSLPQEAFSSFCAPPLRTAAPISTGAATDAAFRWKTAADIGHSPHSLSTKSWALDMTSSPPLFSAAVVSTVSKSLIQRAVLILAAAMAVVFRKRILWPGAMPDKTLKEPLPPGSYGCPFIGFNMMSGSEKEGPFAFVNKISKQLGRPKLFKFYGFGRPFVCATGKETIQELLRNEFGGGVGTDLSGFPNYVATVGDKSVLYEKGRNKHAMLRRIVGVAMTPPALVKAFPAIEQAAKEQVECITSAATEDVVMEKICHDFTMDVAWRQIIGLDLDKEESAVFRKNVEDWVGGMFNPLMFLPFKLPWIKRTRAYKAKEGLVEAVEQKLKQLDHDGPDGSTLSAIYFATDEDGVTRLSRDEVIQNALILIVAGSETSANSLVNSMLFLGLHKDVLAKLQQEQRDLIDKYGPELTKDRLEECDYLDSVIRETLRIRPIPTMEMRFVEKSMVVDGQQVPKKWGAWINIRGTHDMDPVCSSSGANGEHMDVMKGFKPERWQNADTKPTEWIPFGEGARRCLGERLAMVEMKIFLATLARNLDDFDLVNVSDPYKDIKLKSMSVLPVPKDGVVIRPIPVTAPVAA